jgi:hypothetical protein
MLPKTSAAVLRTSRCVCHLAYSVVVGGRAWPCMRQHLALIHFEEYFCPVALAGTRLVKLYTYVCWFSNVSCRFMYVLEHYT